MKHLLYLFLSSMLITLLNGSVYAQQMVQIYPDTGVFSWTTCPTPVSGVLNFSGLAANYNPATDSIVVDVAWGDGTISSDTVPLIESGVIDDWDAYFTHTYTIAGTYVPMIVATAPNGIADTLLEDPIHVSSYCVTIDGYTYDDLNSNCTLESTDDTLIYKPVRITNSTGNVIAWAYTNGNGYYSVSVPGGLTGLSIGIIDYQTGLSTVCPVASSYTFNSTSSQSFDFALDCLPASIDKHHWNNVDLGGPGQLGQINVTTTAISCSSLGNITDTVVLILDPMLHYTGVMSGAAPNVVSGDTLIWYSATSFNSLGATLTNSNVLLQTDTSLSLYDTVCIGSYSNLISSGEIDTTNNIREWCPQIGVSYDPNNKLVFPSGSGVNGNVDTSTQQLSYVVNFQNTGTGPANNVFIVDTISENLDLGTMRINGFSHDMEVQYLKDRAIRFNFNDINLIDSATNEELSKGFFAYTIDLVDQLPIGTQIENTAAIYFDYNEPIITNTTRNTLYVEPVPSPDSLIIALSKRDVTCLNSDNGRVSVQIQSGNPPYDYVWNTGDVSSSLDNLQAGVYSVTVTDDLGFEQTESVSIEEHRQYEDPVVGEFDGFMSVEAWETYIYGVPSAAGHSFEWNAVGGEVTNAVSNQAEILWYGGPQGTVRVTQFSEHGCKASKEIDVQILFVGQEELQVKDLRISPNPVVDRMYLADAADFTNLQVEIFDMSGRSVLLETVISPSQESINISSLAKGPYLVQIEQDGQKLGTVLIIKE